MDDKPIKKLTDAERWKKLSQADLTQAASEISEKSTDKASEIAEELGAGYMAEVISQLGSDTAAELLRNLPQEFGNKILQGVEEEKANNVREVLSYPEGTAGSLMSKEYLAVPMDITLSEAEEYLRSAASKKGKVSYIYAVDKEGRMAGVIQIRDIIFHPKEKRVSEILKGPVVQVETGMPQQEVIKLLQRHRYLGLPVVDEKQKLVGVISADSVFQAAQEEASDDIAKLIGTSAEEIKGGSVLRILSLRLPWLFVSIASGLFCAFLSGLFEHSIEQITVLLLFIPVVLGLSEGTGVQGATIIVRNLTLGNTNPKELARIFLREVSAGVFIGLICGSIVGVIAYFWKSYTALGLALALSLLVTIFASGAVGLCLPLIFRKFKIDPAIASGPLVLAVCDIITLFVYFNVSGSILSS